MSGSSWRARRGLGPLPRLACAFLLAAAVVSPQTAVPASAAAWGPCLDCHAEEGFSVDTAAGKPFNLTVSEAQLAGSVHRALECDGCHRGINLDKHPEGVEIASAEEYRKGATQACLGCHPAERLRAKPQHAALVAEGRQAACVECHGAHGVRPVAVLRGASEGNAYCLTCHARVLAGGAEAAPAVDAAQLKGSVHPNHKCTDCHPGFSASVHPERVADPHQRALAAARACARCHEEKMRQAEGSIHFSLLRSGADGAPACTNCHSAHAVAPKERLATLTGSPCRSCHQEIFAAYSGSMHGRARATEEHPDAPMCSGCHRAHDVQGSASPELVRAACVGCHPAIADLHDAWLPNAALHLEAVTCVACHAPEARRVVALRLVDEGTGRLVTEREVASVLGTDASSALDPAGDGIDGVELWTSLRRLQAGRLAASGAKVDIVGRLEVARGVDAHRLADKAGAIRSCESCHESGSPAFGTVAVSLARDDGRPKRFPGSPEVLTEAASIVSMHGFYALGGTRYRLLDWLLPLAVAGGLGVVALHLTFRLRAARAHKKG